MEQRVDVLERIARRALDADVPGVRLVGIDGPSGSGKSTLAARVATRLGAPTVPIDDFVSWGDVTGWWPRFEEQVLAPLLAGRDAVYQQRDWSDWRGDSLGGWRTVAWAPVVVLEGVTCTRGAAGPLACRVWVETPRDERLRRGLERDGAEHRSLWERWMREEDAFFAADATRARADVVVPGTA
ncbi:uridine kinase [Rathayibacter tanaceti]|uniref:Uridine kinase n=2 Tax=Rathayibacter tanaceti TaxID=1671680 RepID=A0ACD2XGX2_9MICO|nr:(d)CMP kinase [Rathayibacter tanaceti]TCO33927.1 uridine kinase [Rathayibacter tanaceti]